MEQILSNERIIALNANKAKTKKISGHPTGTAILLPRNGQEVTIAGIGNHPKTKETIPFFYMNGDEKVCYLEPEDGVVSLKELGALSKEHYEKTNEALKAKNKALYCLGNGWQEADTSEEAIKAFGDFKTGDKVIIYDMDIMEIIGKTTLNEGRFSGDPALIVKIDGKFKALPELNVLKEANAMLLTEYEEKKAAAQKEGKDVIWTKSMHLITVDTSEEAIKAFGDFIKVGEPVIIGGDVSTPLGVAPNPRTPDDEPALWIRDEEGYAMCVELSNRRYIKPSPAKAPEDKTNEQLKDVGKMFITIGRSQVLLDISDEKCNEKGYTHGEEVIAPDGTTMIALGLGTHPLHDDIGFWFKQKADGEYKFASLDDQKTLNEEGFVSMKAFEEAKKSLGKDETIVLLDKALGNCNCPACRAKRGEGGLGGLLEALSEMGGRDIMDGMLDDDDFPFGMSGMGIGSIGGKGIIIGMGRRRR